LADAFGYGVSRKQVKFHDVVKQVVKLGSRAMKGQERNYWRLNLRVPSDG
jgi:hypothetical protein